MNTQQPITAQELRNGLMKNTMDREAERTRHLAERHNVEDEFAEQAAYASRAFNDARLRYAEAQRAWEAARIEWRESVAAYEESMRKLRQHRDSRLTPLKTCHAIRMQELENARAELFTRYRESHPQPFILDEEIECFMAGFDSRATDKPAPAEEKGGEA